MAPFSQGTFPLLLSQPDVILKGVGSFDIFLLQSRLARRSPSSDLTKVDLAFLQIEVFYLLGDLLIINFHKNDPKQLLSWRVVTEFIIPSSSLLLLLFFFFREIETGLNLYNICEPSALCFSVGRSKNIPPRAQ